jgi:hypothetical protein
MSQANTRITGATCIAKASECVSATRLGTSSPRISETKVTITTTMPKEMLAAAMSGTPRLSRIEASGVASVAPLYTPVKMLISVMPIWIADRKVVGSSNSATANRAPERP